MELEKGNGEKPGSFFSFPNQGISARPWRLKRGTEMDIRQAVLELNLISTERAIAEEQFREREKKIMSEMIKFIQDPDTRIWSKHE